MADWDDVRRVALALPEVEEVAAHGHTGTIAWRVRAKTFLWERPLRRRDIEELGSDAPDGPVLAARVPDEGAKQALIAADPAGYFTTSHFDGFPAVLVRLDRLEAADLDELATEAWLARAPKRLAQQFLEKDKPMIFITAKFRVRPDDAERWPDIVAEFTQATRSEPGCLWFDWSRSLEDPTEYVLVEAFADDQAGGAHVGSEHFKQAQGTLPPHLVETPRIVNFSIPQDDWSRLGEMAVPGSA